MAGLCSLIHSSCAMCLFASFCTQEIDSTPPATKMPGSPASTRCAAMAMVCRPEEQKRFTVTPEVVTGRPARIAIWRAMLPPVAPSGVAQPMITSSTSAGASFARSTAAFTTCPPMVAPWVMLSAPRQLLQSGVLAVETITASVLLIEFPSFLRKLDEKRRRFPDLALIAFGKTLDSLQHLLQPHRVRIEHRPAAVRREAVAGQVHHVDVGSAQRDAFFQDLRAFIDQCIDQSLDDLLVRDGSRFDVVCLAVILDQFFNFRIADRLAVPRLVQIPALAGLLAEAAELGDLVADFRVDEVRPFLVAALADLPADVEAGHVAHLERAHRQPPLVRRRVHLLRGAAFVEQEQALLPVLLDHAIADEAVANAGDHRHLLHGLAELHGGGEDILGGLLAAHHFQQAHDVG